MTNPRVAQFQSLRYVQLFPELRNSGALYRASVYLQRKVGEEGAQDAAVLRLKLRLSGGRCDRVTSHAAVI